MSILNVLKKWWDYNRYQSAKQRIGNTEISVNKFVLQ